VVARLKRAGAIIVGKTTTPEFGQQCLTQSPLFGGTRNAWRGDRTSGGSSGGSAVAVAAGLVPLRWPPTAAGRRAFPAACNGVVGFKQGLGVVPQGYAQDGFGNISYITPMTRTVADTALMLSVMAGPDPRDPPSTGRPAWDFLHAASLPAIWPEPASPGAHDWATPQSLPRCFPPMRPQSGSFPGLAPRCPN
jgi:aspartyl-tRNA(Asn)/glutamyl-tRNA(Gln) amidotransferase subunit A